MPVLAIVGKILLSLVTSLLTETFIKKAVVLTLEKLAARTQTDADDKLLKAAKEAWGLGEK
jgi:hypothetical protein